MSTFPERFRQAAGDRSDRDLARLLQVTIPTIRRWRAGEYEPHPYLAPAIIRLLRS